MIELSGFLKELQCSYDALTSDSIANRLVTIESRYLLLEFLISELMSLKMIAAQKPTEKPGNVITIHESTTASALKDIALTLNLGKPPEKISAESLFEKINTRLDETLKSIPDVQQRIGKALFNPKKSITDANWKLIETVQKELDEEYNLRRKMLLTRLDVTIQSFKWSDRTKGKDKEISELFSAKYQQLDKLQFGGNRTDMAALLAARDTLAIIEKITNANVRKNTKSKIQRHIMGRVPDRGGRTLELQAPGPEMPSWSKRSTGGDNYRGGRGGGRGRGDFNQNRGQHHQHNQGQGFPPQHYQQKAPYNPANQYSQNSDQGQSNYQSNDSRGGGSRVQGGWSQRGNNQGEEYGQGRGNRGGNYRGRR